ncbi:chitinase-3-like protein 2 isoform X2 [Aethina tumida]|uniref:chitinase-3-like protein 2 isoform X2 n=1 Tax=Aethina tumida TaxID=116153 RepID=UPI0021486527|nr:chitinase-3-like protein 2 isoform X2 [Aethina tumida]
MYAEDHSRYVLLTNGNNRTSWIRDKSTLILFAVLILPVVIFCVSYMTLFGVYEKTVFPITRTSEVSELAIKRAIIYNSQTYNETNQISFAGSKNHSETTHDYKLVCYYNFPNKEVNPLKSENVDPFLCTHINLAFVSVLNNTLYISDAQTATIRRIAALKLINPKLKVLLSVGGAGNTSGFGTMVTNHGNRKTFIKSVMNCIRNYRIDGIDLDWEYPNEDRKQRMHFTQLLEEFRASINRQNKPYLLTVAVAAPVPIVDTAYDVMYMNDYVDYVNLMSYDYHFYTKYTPFTGLNSPLYGNSQDIFIFATLNMNYTVNYWNYKGMDRNKIVVGLPTYGHSFKLMNPRNNGLFAPASGYGKLGSNGFIDYGQVCVFLTLNHISPIFDMDTKSPYASKYLEWISFDDEQSLSYKAEFIRDNHYGGAMVYSMNTDDHKGMCASVGKSTMKKFPLINTIKQVLSEKSLN